jgi:hypothetical protein
LRVKYFIFGAPNQILKNQMMEKDFLTSLGIKAQNDGTSTGFKSTNSGKYIESHSPVDGGFIASTSITSREEQHRKLSKLSVKYLLPKEEKSCGNTGMN